MRIYGEDGLEMLLTEYLQVKRNFFPLRTHSNLGGKLRRCNLLRGYGGGLGKRPIVAIESWVLYYAPHALTLLPGLVPPHQDFPPRRTGVSCVRKALKGHNTLLRNPRLKVLGPISDIRVGTSHRHSDATYILANNAIVRQQNTLSHTFT